MSPAAAAVTLPSSCHESNLPPKDRAANDVEHACGVFEYLKGLSRTQARDDRLWETLSHSVFWSYVQQRWGDSKNVANAVRLHWFVPDKGKASLRSQAISRLWWAAFLTYAPWESDPALQVFEAVDKFRFTRILLRHQQFFVDMVERNYGSDLRMRTCILDAIDRHYDEVGYKDGLSRESSKLFNILLKHRQVPCLDVSEIRAICDEVMVLVVATLGVRK